MTPQTQIDPNVFSVLKEIRYRTSRSRGPGGQHVNKT
ncbi:MAG: hypothetical protein KDD54_01830, partial [Flavobacteriales bacterium]|nr:hypothetical protein [Flavobacteriales bacterium]